MLLALEYLAQSDRVDRIRLVVPQEFCPSAFAFDEFFDPCEGLESLGLTAVAIVFLIIVFLVIVFLVVVVFLRGLGDVGYLADGVMDCPAALLEGQDCEGSDDPSAEYPLGVVVGDVRKHIRIQKLGVLEGITEFADSLFEG